LYPSFVHRHSQVLYGDTDGQLGNLPSGSLDSLISSSPFADSIGSDDPDKRGGLFTKDAKRRNDKNLTGSYGQSDGQLGTMKDEGFDGIVGSPPFIDERAITGRDIKRTRRDFRIGISNTSQNEYGESDGQLGQMPDKGFDASISSPSFAGNTGGRGDASRSGIDPALFDRSSGGMKKGTGESEDNLDHLPMKGFDSAVSSPPYDESTGVPSGGRLQKLSGGTLSSSAQKEFGLTGSYGQTDNQMGNSTGPTFWQAAKDILLECHKLLKPGAYSFWVVKMYVKGGKLIDFPGQWLKLCEVCGFEHIETIIAWQTEDKGTNFDFEGKRQTKVVRRQSFFRLLHIKNHPELAIDSEIVLVLRKASLTGSD